MEWEWSGRQMRTRWGGRRRAARVGARLLVQNRIPEFTGPDQPVLVPACPRLKQAFEEHVDLFTFANPVFASMAWMMSLSWPQDCAMNFRVQPRSMLLAGHLVALAGAGPAE